MNFKFPNQSHYLRTRRKSQGILSGEVAKALKVTAQFYGHIENGQVGIPRNKLPTLVKFLKLNKKELHFYMLHDFSDRLKKEIGL